MTNKIGSGGIDNRPAHVAPERVVKRTTDATSTASTAPAAQPGSGVHLTDSARQLAALEQAIRTLPDVDEARVTKIRLAIANGTYEIAPERIADKLIRVEQTLSQATSELR